MKLVIFEPDQKPKEIEVIDLKDAEEQCGHATFGDSAYVLLNKDGTVLHSGTCETMNANNWDETLFQEYFCEACKTEGRVPFLESTGIYDVIDAINSDHLYASRPCALGIGATKLRVRSAECTDAEWDAITKVKA